MDNFEIDGIKYRLNGWKPDLPDHRDLLYKSKVIRWPLPTRVDLENLCSSIENQGHIGSCTACASTSAAEALYLRSNTTVLHLSKLFVYYATRVWIERKDPSADAGSFIRDAMKAMATYGSCDESLWPYKPNDYGEAPTQEAKDDAKTRLIDKYYRCVNFRAILQSLSERYPVVGGFSFPKAGFSAEVRKTGIIPYPKPMDPIAGGHAVLFVGYDFRKKTIKFANSWGRDWGDRGYGYLPFDFITNGMARDFWTIRGGTFVNP